MLLIEKYSRSCSFQKYYITFVFSSLLVSFKAEYGMLLGQESPRLCSVLLICFKDSQDPLSSSKCNYDLLQLKGKSRISKGKGSLGEVQRKLGTSFQKSSPSGVAQNVLNSSSMESRQHVWSAV